MSKREMVLETAMLVIVIVSFAIVALLSASCADDVSTDDESCDSEIADQEYYISWLENKLEYMDNTTSQITSDMMDCIEGNSTDCNFYAACKMCGCKDKPSPIGNYDSSADVESCAEETADEFREQDEYITWMNHRMNHMDSVASDLSAELMECYESSGIDCSVFVSCDMCGCN
jgi:hypothetical protein